ncbi:protein-associating with the carboxyl-terminal domain of ezrin [Sitodiplosis mosellana]|uniref:protein-associating with the carboxyl-terminal domain of ezrin n=1 Tax=Sitodiplosis mosellana TaxID=263140 RepID=UPI002443EB91|nr:protein-associating with the carboxyl-terminal domain of ezrin [Sitodiplosis mosellana]
MGNDQSHIKGLEVDKKAIDSTEFWSIYNGELKNENIPTTLITIFQGEQVVKGQLWSSKSPLERATRNFMLYRHPSILRFITSWEKGSVHYLATERCKTLSMVLATQNDTQICLGLRNILCALIFLVEKANMCHLNVCTSSVYVNSSGSWRLGGFEHLWSKKEVNQTLLERSQTYRYTNALDKDETKRDSIHGIESFAFGVLCEEILSNRKNSSTIPHVAEFRKYCVEYLRNSNAKNRPSLSAVLQHSYFNQDFVLIHSFLSELPLKNQIEKQTFFTGLVDRLREFDETVIGTELIELILSRMVLLDETAKLCVLPFVMQPRNDCESNSASITPIFSSETFTKFVAPKIKQLFLVRDVQIRLVLLEYFAAYMDYFESKEDLTKQVLPQLLLGIKDTNDQLVAATLRCLADLVPILGSSVVIGSNRCRIFADGKPYGVLEKMDLAPSVKWAEVRSITPVMNGAGIGADIVSSSPLLVSSSPLATDTGGDVSDSFVSIVNSTNVNGNEKDLMPERLSPDGAAVGEDLQLNNEQADLDEDGWSDWETDQQSNEIQTDAKVFDDNENINESSTIVTPSYQRNISVSSSNSTATNQNNESFIKDVKDIEIKPINTHLNDEIDDFFKEMEPVIAMPSLTLALLNNLTTTGKPSPGETKKHDIETDAKIDQNRFAVTASLDDDTFDDAAWGNEASDWDN